MEGVLCGTEGFNVLLELLSSKRVSDVGQVERESGGCGCGLHGCDGAEGLAALLQLQSELKPLEPGSVFMGPVIGGVTAIHEGLILGAAGRAGPREIVDRAVLRVTEAMMSAMEVPGVVRWVIVVLMAWLLGILFHEYKSASIKLMMPCSKIRAKRSRVVVSLLAPIRACRVDWGGMDERRAIVLSIRALLGERGPQRIS
jgi:hypothetical protein